MAHHRTRRRTMLVITVLAALGAATVLTSTGTPVAASTSVVLEETFLPPLENGWDRVERAAH